MATAVSQHPMMNGPGEFQSYLEYEKDRGQLVLISKTKITCKNEIELVGTVKNVSIKCKGTDRFKCPYGNMFIHVKSHTCGT